MKTAGFFLTLEGGEGSGKSTLSRALCAALKVDGIDVIQTREPGGTPLAEDVRSLVLMPGHGETWTPMGQALLMNAARADHLAKLIKPGLKNGAYVICDRFSDSTLAYQSAKGDVSLDTLEALESVVLAECRPDLTVLLDAEPEDLLRRRTSRGAEDDVFETEGLEFHRQIRETFLALANRAPGRFLVIDALQPTDKTVSVVMDKIKARQAHGR